MTFQSVFEPSHSVAAAHPDRIIVINDHSVSNGGTAALCLLSIRAFRAKGIPVTLICGDAGDAPDLAALGVDIRALGSADLLKRSKASAALDGIHHAGAEALVRNTIAELDTPRTVVHVHGWAQILSPSIFAPLKAVAARTFLHAHDAFLACPNGMYMDYQRNSLCARRPMSASCIATHCDKRSYAQKLWRVTRHKALSKSLDKSANWAGVLTIHPDVAERFTRAGFRAETLKTVRNPAKPYSATRVAAEDNQTVLYVGRLERDKGVLDLAEAARAAGVKLRMIGDGALFDEIRERFPEIELTGWQSPKQIEDLVQDARALVMPSHHPEPFAMVIPEAVQSGIPVLVSDTAALAPEVETRGFGFAFNVFAQSSLKDALVRLREMPQANLAAMSNRCFDGGHILSNTQDGWIADLLQHYAEAVHASVEVTA